MNRQDRRAAAATSQRPHRQRMDRNRAIADRKLMAARKPSAAALPDEATEVELSVAEVVASALMDVQSDRKDIVKKLIDRAQTQDEVHDSLSLLLDHACFRYREAFEARDAVKAVLAVADLMNAVFTEKAVQASESDCQCADCNNIRAKLGLPKKQSGSSESS